MTGEHLLLERATVTSRVPTGERSAYGNVLVAPVVRARVPCWHHQTARSETSTVAEETWDAYFPAGDPLAETDQVAVAGETFEVVGRPWQPVNPRTGELGLVQATLQRSDG